MKVKEWFSISAIKKEAKKITWLKKGELVKNTLTVLAFCLFMSLFFYVSDAVITLILRMLGLN